MKRILAAIILACVSLTSQAQITGAVFPHICTDSSAASPCYTFASNTNKGFYSPAAGTIGIAIGGVNLGTWSSTGFVSAGAYNTSTGGGVGNYQFGVGSPGNWEVKQTGHLAPITDNAYDIGTGFGGVSPRTIFAMTKIVTPVIDTNAAVSLDLKTNSGLRQVEILNTAFADSRLTMTGAQAPANPKISTSAGALNLASTKGSIAITGFTFANIGTVLTVNGEIGYCSDCTIANPCAGAGTGALAKRLNGVNVCN